MQDLRGSEAMAQESGKAEREVSKALNRVARAIEANTAAIERHTLALLAEFGEDEQSPAATYMDGTPINGA